MKVPWFVSVYSLTSAPSLQILSPEEPPPYFDLCFQAGPPQFPVSTRGRFESSPVQRTIRPRGLPFVPSCLDADSTWMCMSQKFSPPSDDWFTGLPCHPVLLLRLSVSLWVVIFIDLSFLVEGLGFIKKLCCCIYPLPRSLLV